MAHNYGRKNKKKVSAYYGFGTLNVTPVHLTDVEEIWENPTLDIQSLQTIQSFNKPNVAYPNFKYAKKPKKRRKKKKKNNEENKPTRPLSTSLTSKAKEKSSTQLVTNNKNIITAQDSQSIQFELINELKQEISDQIKKQNVKSNDSTTQKQTNKKNKEPIFVPHIRAPMGSPKRPKHQSFQRPPESGGSRLILDVCIRKKKKSSKNIKKEKRKNKNNNRYRFNKPTRDRRKKGNIYYNYTRNEKPITLQSHIHTVNVGIQPINNRLSSTFASNTPRIFPLNKLMENPSYEKHQNIQKSTRVKKKKRYRPWSSKPNKTKTKINKTKKRKKKQKNLKRPTSAPVTSYKRHETRHDENDYASMQSYIANIENIENNAAKDNSLWNPFNGITMFELQYLVAFLRTKQKLYRISPHTLDVLHRCLHFYVSNDSYETAWNAWNIIQKFLLPDNSQLDIDKTLCRQILCKYQTQSRDLKHNHINQDLFDNVIQEIGIKIAENIADKQQFLIEFEKYVIHIQQLSHYDSEPPQVNQHNINAKRPQSASATDLLHNANNSIIPKRPQSALPQSSKNKLINIDEIQSSEPTDNVKIKYCLDGIIDEM